MVYLRQLQWKMDKVRRKKCSFGWRNEISEYDQIYLICTHDRKLMLIFFIITISKRNDFLTTVSPILNCFSPEMCSTNWSLLQFNNYHLNMMMIIELNSSFGNSCVGRWTNILSTQQKKTHLQFTQYLNIQFTMSSRMSEKETFISAAGG